MRIRPVVVDDLFAHARETAPIECCGLLLGNADLVHLSYRARNLHASPVRYRVDPADHFAAIRAARLARLEIVGAYHSHPRSAAVPSDTDLSEATYRDFLYVIVSPGDDRRVPEVRAYRLEGGNFREVILVPQS